MQWSRLKSLLEERFAPSVRPRVVMGFATYLGNSPWPWTSARIWIALDGHKILSSANYYGALVGRPEPERHAANLFSVFDWYGALEEYIDLPIQQALRSPHPIIRALAMLDARTGKRRLRGMDVSQEHDLVVRLYQLRCDAEGIPYRVPGAPPVDLTKHLETRWKQEPAMAPRVAPQMALLSASKATRRLPRLARAIHARQVSQDALDTDLARELYAAFERVADGDRFLDMLLLVDARSKLLDTATYVRALASLMEDACDWERPLEIWDPPSHNPDRQFSSLARHLWAAYDVPLFMDRAWFEEPSLHRRWFRHIGAGRNIRTAEGLPVPLSKKAAHHFVQAPAHYSIEAAFRWAQVHALGGNRRLADALLETPLVTDFTDDEFWQSVLRFLIRNPMLDPAQIAPLIEYIRHQKYEDRFVFLEPGVATNIGPAEPRFTMRGRTVDGLMRAMSAWHRQLGRESKAHGLEWSPSSIQPFRYVEGEEASRDMRVWRIRELLSSHELAIEGRQMHHCVATYARSCYGGRSSIWTMDVQTEQGLEKCLTIEIKPSTRRINLVSGLNNRPPTDDEKAVLQRWAEQEGMEIDSDI